MGGLVIDILVGYFIRPFSNWWKALGSKKWPSVEAVVTAHPITSGGYGGTKVEIVYSYRVQDELYTGIHTEPCFGSESEYMKRFPGGRSVVVRVKPGDPDISVRPLREIYAERKDLIAKYVPADIQAIHARAVEELKQSGIAERTLQPGGQGPSFELSDHNGNPVRSADLMTNGPLVISFIRGRWDPFCVGQLEAMNAIYPDIQKSGATLVAISPQTVHQSSLMADQHKLRFSLLSDAGNRVAERFGLRYRVPEYQQDIYRRVFINLPFVNGDDSWTLPIPATYILDRDHNIRYSASDPDYTVRPEPARIMQFLAQISR